MSFTAHIEQAHSDRAHFASERYHPGYPSSSILCFRACFYFSLEGGLFELPLRVSNEHLPSVRVPRAQESNRLLYSHSHVFPSAHSFQRAGWDGP